MDLVFVSHIQAGMAEQDVYIVKTGSPADQVMRPTPQDGASRDTLAQAVYAAAEPVRDDPFAVEANPFGPFAKGKRLGLSLEAWLGAQGRGTYVEQDGQAEIALAFQGLVPGGSYTVLTPRITFPPHFAVQPGIAGASDGSQAMLHADAQGNATYHLQSAPLPASTKETATALILVYNSDGGWRGDFGKNTHQQLFVMLPSPAGL